MFGGKFADTCTKRILLALMGAWAEGIASADPGASGPIGASGC